MGCGEGSHINFTIINVHAQYALVKKNYNKQII